MSAIFGKVYLQNFYGLIEPYVSYDGYEPQVIVLPQEDRNKSYIF